MVIVMSPDAGPADVATVVTRVEAAGGTAFVSRGVTRTIVGIVGDVDRFDTTALAALPCVLSVVRISSKYKLVSREHHQQRSVVMVGGIPIGPGTVTLIAGPCAVETPQQTLASARLAQAVGATLLRGGAFKPRSSPYAFQGLGVRGLEILAQVRAVTGMPIVTEVLDPRNVETVAEYADMLQIGSRNMQNFPLLQAAGETAKPVLLKRGMYATVEEWLLAAEYIAQRGNLNVVLCERGIRTFETATRNTFDISAVPLLQALSHLPVVVDPSHACGRRDLVVPMVRAGIAAGADAVMVDIHHDPGSSLCDGAQALDEQSIDALRTAVEDLPPVVGRRLVARAAEPHPVG